MLCARLGQRGLGVVFHEGAIGFDVGTEDSSACWRLLHRLSSGTSYVRTTTHTLSLPEKQSIAA